MASETNLKLEESLESALQSEATFERLRVIVTNLLADGVDQTKVYETLDSFRKKLREAGRDDDEDLIMDVIDCVSGWCGPHSTLSPNKEPS